MVITSHYYSYLLRIWQQENQDQNEWFASLEEPKSREVVYFKDMDEMFDYLRKIRSNTVKVDTHYSHH